MKMKRSVIAAVGRRLMKRHDIRERHTPQVIILDQNSFESLSEIARFRVRKFADACARALGRDIDFVSVARKVWDECNCSFILENDAPTVLLFGADDLVKKNAPRFFQMICAMLALRFR